ncbi:unnamed protein product [Mytilus edulis]|uniref:Fucolectin tachylectin-4 pentraxin-1 domain-containing protein n=1 Tax=Mytilus edulis TaxID=6550 RepID=A0A8S3V6Q4_MYTED|nr:unnamed protein product [Mytilus edulis]
MEGINMCIVAILVQLDSLFILGQTNLALNKECRQSSTLNNKTIFSAGVVVDGNTIQQLQVAYSCSHTDHYEPFNWWTVDLGQLFTVDTIIIYNREDSCCGRYVQIYKPNGVDFNITRQPLSLCEVEVYGRSILTDPNDTVIETTTGNSLSTDDSICQCPCDSSTFAWSSNYTKEELQIIMSEKLENLKRELRVQRSVLTSSLRKLNSAGDNRSSSKSIGIAAAIFLIIVVCLIVLLDLIKLENIKVKRKKSKKEIPK